MMFLVTEEEQQEDIDFYEGLDIFIYIYIYLYIIATLYYYYIASHSIITYLGDIQEAGYGIHDR